MHAGAFSMRSLQEPATHRIGGTQRLLQQRLALLQGLHLSPQLLQLGFLGPPLFLQDRSRCDRQVML